MTSLFARLSWAAACICWTLPAATHAQAPPARAYAPPAGAPAMPASPLAGGASAVGPAGYIDAHGRSIVMPAQYAGEYACPPGGEYGCPPGAYDNGMFADFGGSGFDQCGPYYYDLAFEAVALYGEDRYQDVGPLGSVGAGADSPRVLDPQPLSDDVDGGWQATVRVDFGPLSVLEATYMGLYNLGFVQSVNSVDVTDPSTDFQLFSAFSNFGVGTLIPALDDARTYSITSDSDLQSTEFSYRRYWVGHHPRISGTYLLGFRYLRYTDDFTLQSVGLVDPFTIGSVRRTWGSENDLLGFQLGGDMAVCLRQGLRLDLESKAGIYNNRFTFHHVGDFAEGAPGSPADFAVTVEDDQVAFAGECRVDLVADILPSFSLRGGYRLLYLNSLATPGGNIVTSDIASTAVYSQSHVLYHGVHGGLEYVW